jgi:hypothetical protein
MSRLDDLRDDYNRAGQILNQTGITGTEAAALIRERRALRELLDRLEKPKELSVVDQLAEERAKRRGGEPTGARRKPGRGAQRH